jgi:hypothetical protein
LSTELLDSRLQPLASPECQESIIIGPECLSGSHQYPLGAKVRSVRASGLVPASGPTASSHPGFPGHSARVWSGRCSGSGHAPGRGIPWALPRLLPALGPAAPALRWDRQVRPGRGGRRPHSAPWAKAVCTHVITTNYPGLSSRRHPAGESGDPAAAAFRVSPLSPAGPGSNHFPRTLHRESVCAPASTRPPRAGLRVPLCVRRRAFEDAAEQGSRSRVQMARRGVAGWGWGTKWFSAAKEGSASAPLSRSRRKSCINMSASAHTPGAATRDRIPEIAAATTEPNRGLVHQALFPQPFCPCLNGPRALHLTGGIAEVPKGYRGVIRGSCGAGLRLDSERVGLWERKRSRLCLEGAHVSLISDLQLSLTLVLRTKSAVG